MSDLQRWRGLKALVADAVEHGSRAVEKLQLDAFGRVTSIVQIVPGVEAPAEVTRAVHATIVRSTHASIRAVSRAVGGVLDEVLDVIEQREPGARSS